MPHYSYRCRDCSHEYEVFQAMKDDPHKICPECEGTVERLIGGGAGILFKGSGFYVTDYKKNPAGSAPSNGETSNGNGERSGGAKGTDSAKASDNSSSKGNANGNAASNGNAATAGSGSGSGAASKNAR